MKTLLTSLAFLSVLGSSSVALGCLEVMGADTVPSSAEDVIPSDGVIYVVAGDRDVFEEEFAAVMDPDEALVVWEFVTQEFSAEVVGVRPEGGWIVGDYIGGSWGEEVLFRTVVDRLDTTPPVISIDSWEGRSKRLASPGMLDSCGGDGSADAGLFVRMTEADEPVVYVAEVSHAGPVSWDTEEVVSFWNSLFVATPQGDRVNVTVTAYDLSGNSSSVTLVDAQGCSGSGSSIAGGRGDGVLALLSLLAFGIYGRRRERLG